MALRSLPNSFYISNISNHQVYSNGGDGNIVSFKIGARNELISKYKKEWDNGTTSH